MCTTSVAQKILLPRWLFRIETHYQETRLWCGWIRACLNACAHAYSTHTHAHAYLTRPRLHKQCSTPARLEVNLAFGDFDCVVEVELNLECAPFRNFALPGNCALGRYVVLVYVLLVDVDGHDHVCVGLPPFVRRAIRRHLGRASSAAARACAQASTGASCTDSARQLRPTLSTVIEGKEASNGLKMHVI
jgi:hypothetical protein